ncbi:NAD-P-binding protein [Cubamyces sp. BRFM 1775]|nr:NAD-P-binding protein [Cubamyces sp. BRFM 1775]
MPTISAPERVFVTGANGFLGCWIVHRLLENGYSVRASVRTPEKARALTALIAKRHPNVGSQTGESVSRFFECVVVPDLTQDDAYEHCLDGVAGIVHTATPVVFGLDDPAEYYKPAIQGTMNLLKTAAKHTTVKRIVLTSSIGAMANAANEPKETYVGTEDDWNDYGVETVAKIGKAAPAAWKFYKDNKEELPYELIVIAPGWIFGPLPGDQASPEESTGSAELQWQNLFATPAPSPPYPAVFNYVDVRDAADLHIRALEVEEAAGERFAACSEVCTWQDWYDAAGDMKVDRGLSKLHPPRPQQDPGRAGIRDDFRDLPPHYIFRGDKARNKLGFAFRGVPETIQDVVRDFKKRGWLRHLEVD